MDFREKAVEIEGERIKVGNGEINKYIRRREQVVSRRASNQARDRDVSG